MASDASIIRSLEALEWDADVYGSLSAFSNLALQVKNKANALRLAYLFHKANNSLQTLFDRVHATMEGRNPIPADSVEPITEKRCKELGENLDHLIRKIDYIYETARRAGLTNNSLTSGALARMREHSEELLNLVDWVDVLRQKDAVQDIFERAARDRETGEVFEIEKVI